MNTEKFNGPALRFKYTVELGWRELYEFCDEQRDFALRFAESAIANRVIGDDDERPKAVITVTEEGVE